MPRLPWVKLHRSLLDWEWYEDKEARLLWIHLILTAHEGEWRHMGATFPPGTLVVSYAELAAAVGLSTRTVSKRLELFIKTGEIKMEPDPAHVGAGKPRTLITINHWSDRQTQNAHHEKHMDATKGKQSETTVGENVGCKKNGGGKHEMHQETQSEMHQETQQTPYLIINNKENLEIERDKEDELSRSNQSQDLRYPTTAQEVIQAAEVQCIKLTEDDALIFIDNYRSKGWMVGGSRITDWKARIRLFAEARKQITHQNQGGNNANTIRGGHVVGHEDDFANDPLFRKYQGS